MMHTKYKRDQIVKIKSGFNRGTFVKLLGHKVGNNNENEYQCTFVRKSGERFVDINPKKTEWVMETDLTLPFKIFGRYL